MNEGDVCRCVSGSIGVICGPMCSGKTQHLISKLRRAEIAGIPVFVFKPGRGRQQKEEEIVSRQGCTMQAYTLINNSALEAVEVVLGKKQRCAIGFDEAHWITDLRKGCENLVAKGHLVYVAGLDMDWQGIPYSEICMTMGVAETVEKLTAVSVKCGCPATHTYRVGDGEDAGGTWEPRCRYRWQCKK